MQDIERIRKIKTTKTISQVKEMLPKCGLLYGFLSDKTHLDFSNHHEFLKIENGQNVILHSKSNFYDYAYVILTLADLFGIVWELSQVDYLSEVESIEVKKGCHIIKQDRPFIKIMEHHLHNIENYSEQTKV